MDHHKILDLIMDSRDVTVGGGSAAAIAAAMAAGLVGMVARLSIASKGKEYGLTDESYLKLADELDNLAGTLKRGSVEDTEAYLAIKRAYALPKETEAEKALRRTEIEKAGIAAANIPLKNAKNAARVLEIACLLRDKSNPNAGSDLACGNRLAAFAVHGALLNVEANLPLIKTPSLLEPFQQALKEYRELLERK